LNSDLSIDLAGVTLKNPILLTAGDLSEGQSMIKKMSKYGFGAIYAIRRSAWKETEDQNTLKRINRSEDSFLYLSIKKKFKIEFIKTNYGVSGDSFFLCVIQKLIQTICRQYP